MTSKHRRSKGEWNQILEAAARIVREYDTGVTLRQLFYRLVVLDILKNTQTEYNQLSTRTAEARRKDGFPALMDRTRDIHRHSTWESPERMLEAAVAQYRMDRTLGQAQTLYIVVEKSGLLEQLRAWFGDLGLPIVALGGYASQTLVDEVAADAKAKGRPAVLIYAGDFDPSGEDIFRDFVDRTGCFAEVDKVALSSDQVELYQLPAAVGKTTDTRAASFQRKHGALVQVELDALPPTTLRDLYQQAIDRRFDRESWQAVLEQETEGRTRLEQLVEIC